MVHKFLFLLSHFNQKIREIKTNLSSSLEILDEKTLRESSITATVHIDHILRKFKYYSPNIKDNIFYVDSTIEN